jgi:hypothetical protein
MKINTYKTYLIIIAFVTFILQLQNITGLILDEYGFRQTQTAITVFWFQKEGIQFPYLTPVFGWPWAAPFEFPTYQLIVYWFASIFKISSLDLAGRIVSLIFYYATFLPLYNIFKKLDVDIKTIYIIFIVILVMPVFIFWPRTFMIESAAVFFGLLFVQSVLSYEYESTYFNKNLFFIVVTGVVAALTKITTFLVVLNFLFFYILMYYSIKNTLNKRVLVVLFSVGLIMLLGMTWTSYTDQIKSLNSISSYLTSSNLSKWNFGSVEQRLDLNNYKQIIGHIQRNSAPLIYLLILLPGMIFLKFRYKKLLFVSILVFTTSFLILFNLYYVHGYYWYANSIFLAIAIGIVVSNITNFFKANIATHLLISGVIILGYYGYSSYYWEIQSKKYDNYQVKVIGDFIKSLTNENDLIYIRGLDWSSELPYYSERKSIMIPGWYGIDIGDERFEEILGNSTKKNNVKGIVLCGPSISNYLDTLEFFDIQSPIELTNGRCTAYIESEVKTGTLNSIPEIREAL